MRKLIFLLLILGVVLPTAYAQNNQRWAVLLHNPSTGELLRFYDTGEIEVMTLNLEAGYTTYEIVVNDTNPDQVAFCATNAEGEVKLIIRDIKAAINQHEIEMGQPAACTVSRFNVGGTLVAVSVVHNDPEKPFWELLLVDAATGETAYALNNTSAIPGLANDRVIIPYVTYFSAPIVMFQAIVYGTDGVIGAPVYQWRYSEETPINLEDENTPWNALAADVLGGAVIWTVNDPALPAAEATSPIPVMNAIRWADKSGDRRNIFHTADEAITDVKFINYGAEIAIQLWTMEGARWVVLDETGQITEVHYDSDHPGELVNARGGYVLLTSERSQTSVAYQLALHDGTVLWASGELPATDDWRIAWVLPVYAPFGVGNFPSVDE